MEECPRCFAERPISDYPRNPHGRGRQLTTAESQWQEKLALDSAINLHHIVTTITRTLGDSVQHGILLSGGVESTTLLFTMLDAGIRPHVFSWTGGSGRHYLSKYASTTTNEGSSDFMRAQSIAHYYNLPFHAFTADFNDPEGYAQHCLDTPVSTIPAFEVSYLYKQLAAYAKQCGITTLWSGFGEGNLQFMGRKNETLGRKGLSTPLDRLIAHAGVMSSESEQAFALEDVCASQGVNVVLPMMVWGSILSYANASFGLMNIPRQKWVSARAFDHRYQEVGHLPYTAAMQSRDASSREDFNSLIERSKTVQEAIGDQVNYRYWYNHCIRLKDTSSEPPLSIVVDEGDQWLYEHDIRATNAFWDCVDVGVVSLLKHAAKAAQNGSKELSQAYCELVPYVLDKNTDIHAQGVQHIATYHPEHMVSPIDRAGAFATKVGATWIDHKGTIDFESFYEQAMRYTSHSDIPDTP